MKNIKWDEVYQVVKPIQYKEEINSLEEKTIQPGSVLIPIRQQKTVQSKMGYNKLYKTRYLEHQAVFDSIECFWNNQRIYVSKRSFKKKRLQLT